jgi:diguanylate cyclase (GGDEF)-like protein
VVRDYDATGRYGGEEFLLILPGCDFSTTLAQAERIRMSVYGDKFQLPDATHRMTCSFGFAWTDEPDASQANELIRRADTALYAAKRSGRNRVEAYALHEPVA